LNTMGETSAFETLVLELNADERNALLDRLTRASSVSREPLSPATDAPAEQSDYAALYSGLGFFLKIFIALKSMVTGVSRETLVKERVVRKVGHGVESAYPGLYDSRRKVLLEPFRRELASLRGASRYFYELLDRTLEKSRAPFFAFLGSLQFERVHEELSTDADPFVFAERNALAGDADVRTAVNAAFESALAHIDEDSRRAMLRDVRNLHALKKLSGFLFDRLIGGYQGSQSGRKELSLYAVSEQMDELSTILASLDPPSPKLMEAILAFSMGEDLGSTDFDLEEAVARELAAAEKALGVIRAFNATVPMAALVRLAFDDPNRPVGRMAGGEDWFALFKAYWKERIDRRFQRWSAERRVAQLEAEVRLLVGANPPSMLEYVSQAGAENVPPVRFALALRLLEAFYQQVFLRDINRVLKVVLLEGEFYKRDNRVDFTDSYNAILQTGDALKLLDRRVSPDGELGAAWHYAKTELIPLQIKKRKVESAVLAADTEAEAIIRKATDAMSRMQLIIRGILAGEARGRYDSLSNLSRMEGKANKDFLKALEQAKDKFEKAVYLLGELSRAALSANDQV